MFNTWNQIHVDLISSVIKEIYEMIQFFHPFNKYLTDLLNMSHIISFNPYNYMAMEVLLLSLSFSYNVDEKTEL